MRKLKIKQKIKDSLKQVKDPDIGMDIVTLGFIRNIEINIDSVNIIMTLSSPSCPYGPVLIEQVKNKVNELGFKQVNVDLQFTPPWEPPKEVKMMLGL